MRHAKCQVSHNRQNKRLSTSVYDGFQKFLTLRNQKPPPPYPAASQNPLPLYFSLSHATPAPPHVCFKRYPQPLKTVNPRRDETRRDETMTSVTSVELNYLVFRYLQESGSDVFFSSSKFYIPFGIIFSIRVLK